MATIQENAQKIDNMLRYHEESDANGYQNALSIFAEYKPFIDVEINGEFTGDLREYIGDYDDKWLEILGNAPFSDFIVHFVAQGLQGLISGRDYYTYLEDEQPCGCWYGHRTGLKSSLIGENISNLAFRWVNREVEWTRRVTPIEAWLIECVGEGKIEGIALDPHTNIHLLLFLQYLCTRYSQITQGAIA